VSDFHGHRTRWEEPIPDTSAAGIVTVMDRIGVEQIFVSSLECTGARTGPGNDEVLAAMREFPGRFLGYVTVWPESTQAVRTEVEQRLAEGFSGVKLHIANGFDYTHPNYAPAYEIADERRLPVLVHTYGRQRGLEQIPGLAKLYPGANFLLAHSGVDAVEEYIRMAGEHSNVYLELCGSMCAYGLIEKFVKSVPVEKILWGSDTYFINMAHQSGRVLGADIPEETKKKLLSTNAKQLLGMIRR